MKLDAETVQKLITDSQSESLHLEFKTLSDPSGTRITKDDRRMIAKALCGFSNADGGTLILGVDTKKIDGLDVAVRLVPIQNASRFCSLLMAALPEMLQPSNDRISVHVAALSGAAGVVVVHVDSSRDRPYMSVPAGQFFRRTFDSTRMLDRSEVRDLFNVSKDASLKLNPRIVTGATTGDRFYWLRLHLALENTGQSIALSPYLAAPLTSGFRNVEGVNTRRSLGHNKIFFTTPETMIHLADEFSIAFMPLGFRLRNTIPDLKTALASLRATKNGADFSLNDGSSPTQAPPLVLPNEVVHFGAANAQRTSVTLSLSINDLLDLICDALEPR